MCSLRNNVLKTLLLIYNYEYYFFFIVNAKNLERVVCVLFVLKLNELNP